MVNLNNIYKITVNSFISKLPFKVDTAVILGSGLGDFAESFESTISLLVSEITNYPLSTVQGHIGKIHFLEYSNRRIMLFQGRIHFYEGYSLMQCLLPVHLSLSAGAKNIIITNAAGGVNPTFNPGDLVLINGFNSMNLKKEIAQILGAGTPERKYLLAEISKSDFYNYVKNQAIKRQILLKEGVYWFTKGPSYETPAEIQFIRRFGGDAVGMSSVHEAIYAVFRGMNICMISCITNFAAGLSPYKLSHNEVQEVANKVKSTFSELIRTAITF